MGPGAQTTRSLYNHLQAWQKWYPPTHASSFFSTFGNWAQEVTTLPSRITFEQLNRGHKCHSTTIVREWDRPADAIAQSQQGEQQLVLWHRHWVTTTVLQLYRTCRSVTKSKSRLVQSEDVRSVTSALERLVLKAIMNMGKSTRYRLPNHCSSPPSPRIKTCRRHWIAPVEMNPQVQIQI